MTRLTYMSTNVWRRSMNSFCVVLFSRRMSSDLVRRYSSRFPPWWIMLARSQSVSRRDRDGDSLAVSVIAVIKILALDVRLVRLSVGTRRS